MTTRTVKTVAIQVGPSSMDKNVNIKECLRLADEAGKLEPDFIVFPELTTTPYFPLKENPKYFDWAEPIPGPTFELFAKWALEHSSHVVLPIFEKGELEGEYYDSVALIGRNGDLVEGVLPNGKRVPSYRKIHLPCTAPNLPTWGGNNEKYYFTPGRWLPTFPTDRAKVGCLVCYDRSFPEAWRVLTLAGSEIIFIPIATMGAMRERTQVPEMSIMAFQNGVFVVASSKGGGPEVFEDRESTFLGLSTIIDSDGVVMTQAPKLQGPAIIHADLNLSEVKGARQRIQFIRDRRPDLYGPVSGPYA